MKSLLFAIVLLSGSAAIAQTDSTAPAQDPAPAPAAAPAPMAGQVVEPSNAHPELDARRIVVISASAIVPPGFNGTTDPMTGQGGPATADASATTPDATYVPCSRTVTDNCIQVYERGRRPS